MSDWLIEIEAHSKKFRDDFITPEQEAGGLLYIDEMSNERMARVLRELVEILLDSFCARCDEPTRLCECRELSDDTKELLK